MNNELSSLSKLEKIPKDKLLTILREDAKTIGLNDIITSSLFLHHDARFVQANYRKEYLKSYIKGFLTRIRDVKEDENSYPGVLDMEEFEKAVELLDEHENLVEEIEDTEPAFFRIYKIIALYTTFILDEPIHQVGTLFPGGIRIKYEEGVYFCPVKKNNEDNPLAVCPFCIAEQDPESK